jgi:serine/threonine-protein kinase
MTKHTFTFGILITVGSLVATSSAWADPSPSDKAASDVLFKDAKKLIDEGRFNEACPKFEESQRLDPTPGTLLNLGDCYKSASPPRNASAWGAYRQAEAMARQRGDAARQDGAALRAQTVEPLLSKVTIDVPPAARIPGLEVKWDGRPVGEGLFGSAFPVDAGEHAIVASAPGHKSWTGKGVVGANAATTNVAVPILPLGAPDPTPGSVAPGVPYWGTQRVLGLGIGVAGLAGIVVGSIFGVKAANKNADSLPHCQPNNIKLCDATGVALGEDAFGAAAVSTVGFIAGGLGLAGGTILFLTAPSGTSKSTVGRPRLEAAPIVGFGVGGVSLRGVW